MLDSSLLPVEERFEIIQVRIKRHRWYSRTLVKNNDPLIFSLGWKRFQCIPIYSLDDRSIRMATLLSMVPVTLPNAGFCAFNSLHYWCDVGCWSFHQENLNSTGVPYKNFKNKASMFSGALEVAKYEGANVRTVSGISSGQTRNALSKPGRAI